MGENNDSSVLLEQERIKAFLQSDCSLDVLLARLKESLNTGEELAKFVKKKAQIEDEHFNQLKKFGSSSRVSMRNSTKLKQDSFSRQLDKLIEFDESMYSIGSSYVKALSVMFDELTALIATVSRSRKIIKDEGKRKEKECIDSIIAADKAKQRYYHLCDDLEKLKSGGPNKKSFSLKNKSVSQQEDDLVKKVEIADQEYKAKVMACKKLKDEIMVIHRPNNNKKLKNLILELDIAMNVQLQKYVTWNENLIMNTGVLICPIQSSKASMKSVVSAIVNEKDLYDYLIKHERDSVPKTLTPVEYVVHPSLARQQKAHKPFLNNQKQDHTNVQAALESSTPSALATSTFVANSASTNSYNYSQSTANTPMVSKAAAPSTFAAPEQPSQQTPQLSESGTSNYTYSSLDPATSSDLHGPKNLHSQPTFGVSIEEVIQFAGIDNVPLVVKRCLDVIENYGLDIEGIYRTSGNKATVQQLKESIDENFTNYLLIGNNINPSNVHDADIYCVASLLKLYFASLPEPLLTAEYYHSFIETVKSQDQLSVAKKLHHLVYNLPDGAYFTLRSLIFHLNKVAANESRNRMTPKSLAIIWGPAILNDNSMSAQDLSYKSKVVEELMMIANDIFDTDS